MINFSSLTADGGEEPTSVDWEMVNRLTSLLFFYKSKLVMIGLFLWGSSITQKKKSRQQTMMNSYFQGSALSAKPIKKHSNGWEQQWENIRIQRSKDPPPYTKTNVIKSAPVRAENMWRTIKIVMQNLDNQFTWRILHKLFFKCWIFKISTNLAPWNIKTASQMPVAPRIAVHSWQYAPDVAPDMPHMM